ncbi:asparaginase [Siccirubricoccus sp. G192]|uniref:asparaginase n=1 Tax=Siccirubricoccus sp. G192 TaxID=2849651 RepID=UPI001C2C535D|nr:asparaginase [Siccirubricoccus sp. G192]MBV1799817.1 asparaginase [Siccirubricoccus sp. G192]
MRPKVAFIGTGGTIASVGRGPLDIFDYGANGTVLQADAILARFPEVQQVAEVVPIRFRNLPSTRVGWEEWRELLLLCEDVAAAQPDLAGIVIGHGTSSLEETAYFLSLTLKTALPVVLVGAQRPNSALSSDAGLNLVNAVRVAASEGARGLGVLVLLNDEIHAAREVTKTSTGRLQTFRSPDFGCLGHADGDSIAWYRRPLRRVAPDTGFDARGLAVLPRVDIAYTYAGADGTAVRAFLAAGAQGIVCAGFAPGFVTPGDALALQEARALGVTVVVSTRAGSGRVFPTTKLREAGFLPADNLTPQKARILLALALTRTAEQAEIARMFGEY